MTDDCDCLLTLAIPAALEEELLDQLNARTQWVSGYSVASAEGVGRGSALHSSIEQVRGRARRRLIQLMMKREHLRPLLDELAAQFQTPEIAWWVVGIEGMGRFG